MGAQLVEGHGEPCPKFADKEGKSVVFPSLWLTAENQSIDFPYFH